MKCKLQLTLVARYNNDVFSYTPIFFPFYEIESHADLLLTSPGLTVIQLPAATYSFQQHDLCHTFISLLSTLRCSVAVKFILTDIFLLTVLNSSQNYFGQGDGTKIRSACANGFSATQAAADSADRG